MVESLQSKTAHDMCISSCDFYSVVVRGGCRNPNLFFGWTDPDEIRKTREEMAQENGCRLAKHLGIIGTMVYQDNQWKFIPDQHTR